MYPRSRFALIFPVLFSLAACGGDNLFAPPKCSRDAASLPNCQEPLNPNPGTGPAPSTEEVLTHFFQVATQETGVVWKWEEAIRIEVRGGAEAHRQYVVNAAATIQQATGHPISVVSGGGNVVVQWAPRADFHKYMDGIGSDPPAGRTRYNGVNGRLTDVLIVASTDADMDQQLLAVHELAHAIGMLGHVSKYPSVHARERTFTQYDRIAAAALYRKDIKPGMKLNEVLAVLGLPTP